MKIGCITIGLMMTATSVSFAQQPTPQQMDMAHAAARNQLGVLTYCQSKGYIDGEAVDIQTKMLTLMPAPADKMAGDAAEMAGKNGKVSALGVEKDLAEAAKAQGTDEGQLCKTMADLVKQVGANLPK